MDGHGAAGAFGVTGEGGGGMDSLARLEALKSIVAALCADAGLPPLLRAGLFSLRRRCRELGIELTNGGKNDRMKVDGAKEEWKTVNGARVLFIEGVAMGAAGERIQPFEGSFPHASAEWHLQKRKSRGEYTHLTLEQYKQKALDLIQSEVGGDIMGYRTEGGKIVRWNKATNDYATAWLDGNIKTMMQLTGRSQAAKERRFEYLKNRDRDEMGEIYG